MGARSGISTTVWETTVQILLNTQISLAVFRFPETARLCQQLCCYFQTYLSLHLFDKQTKYSLDKHGLQPQNKMAPNDCHEIADIFILMIQHMTIKQCYQMLHKIITPFTLLPEVRSAWFVVKAGNTFTLKIIHNENFLRWQGGREKKKKKVPHHWSGLAMFFMPVPLTHSEWQWELVNMYTTMQ